MDTEEQITVEWWDFDVARRGNYHARETESEAEVEVRVKKLKNGRATIKYRNKLDVD